MSREQTGSVLPIFTRHGCVQNGNVALEKSSRAQRRGSSGVPLDRRPQRCACRNARACRQQVNAEARASLSWIGGRRRPTHTYYASCIGRGVEVAL
jgi:hypothetical protein